MTTEPEERCAVINRLLDEAAGRLHQTTMTVWPGCRSVFVDTSRNGRRRYCSARCGNYDAVARHRASKA